MWKPLGGPVLRGLVYHRSRGLRLGHGLVAEHLLSRWLQRVHTRDSSHPKPPVIDPWTEKLPSSRCPTLSTTEAAQPPPTHLHNDVEGKIKQQVADANCQQVGGKIIGAHDESICSPERGSVSGGGGRASPLPTPYQASSLYWTVFRSLQAQELTPLSLAPILYVQCSKIVYSPLSQLVAD